MDNKEELLSAIASGLKNDIISRSDLQKIIDTRSDNSSEEQSNKRLSAVDVMFYIAGIVLFAAIVALIGQSWSGGPAVRILLSAGTGALLWASALYLMQRTNESDIRRGMTGALLLTGSLSLITGAFIITNEYINFNEVNFYAVALTLAVLGALHIGFAWQIKRDLVLLVGILLAVAAFPALVAGLLNESNVPNFIYYLITAVSGGLLAYATRVVVSLGASTNSIGRVFDPLSAFIVLMSLYAASFDDSTGLLWLLVLIIGIVGLFYLSITTQNRFLLGNGSFFLVLAIITISYRYFSDNVAISLLISAAGLLGTAIMAASINKRYIK